MTGAWAQGNIGRDDVLVATSRAGSTTAPTDQDGLDSIYPNAGELPYPRAGDGQDLGRYDFDGNGGSTSATTPGPAGQPFACVFPDHPVHHLPPGGHDPAAAPTTAPRKPPLGQHRRSAHSPSVPEDLIAVFGHCKITDHRIRSCPADARIDNDGNGYPERRFGLERLPEHQRPPVRRFPTTVTPGLIGEMGGEADNGCQRRQLPQLPRGSPDQIRGRGRAVSLRDHLR